MADTYPREHLPQIIMANATPLSRVQYNSQTSATAVAKLCAVVGTVVLLRSDLDNLIKEVRIRRNMCYIWQIDVVG